MSFRPVYAKQSKSLLTDITPIKQLMLKASYLNRLQQCVNLYLSKIMQENCSVASFQNNTLTLLAHNAQWATRLRYQQNKLKQQLQNHREFNSIEKIIIKVMPPLPTHTQTAHHRTISMKSAKILTETADSIKHSTLKEALARLAKHTR